MSRMEHHLYISIRVIKGLVLMVYGSLKVVRKAEENLILGARATIRVELKLLMKIC